MNDKKHKDRSKSVNVPKYSHKQATNQQSAGNPAFQTPMNPPMAASNPSMQFPPVNQQYCMPSRQYMNESVPIPSMAPMSPPLYNPPPMSIGGGMGLLPMNVFLHYPDLVHIFNVFLSLPQDRKQELMSDCAFLCGVMSSCNPPIPPPLQQTVLLSLFQFTYPSGVVPPQFSPPAQEVEAQDTNGDERRLYNDSNASEQISDDLNNTESSECVSSPVLSVVEQRPPRPHSHLRSHSFDSYCSRHSSRTYSYSLSQSYRDAEEEDSQPFQRSVEQSPESIEQSTQYASRHPWRSPRTTVTLSRSNSFSSFERNLDHPPKEVQSVKRTISSQTKIEKNEKSSHTKRSKQ